MLGVFLEETPLPPIPPTAAHLLLPTSVGSAVQFELQELQVSEEESTDQDSLVQDPANRRARKEERHVDLCFGRSRAAQKHTVQYVNPYVDQSKGKSPWRKILTALLCASLMAVATLVFTICADALAQAIREAHKTSEDLKEARLDTRDDG